MLHRSFSQYVSTGSLPSRVPVWDLNFPEWELWFVVPSRNILSRRSESLSCAFFDLICIFDKRLRCVPDIFPVPSGADLYTFIYHTFGNILYGANLVVPDISVRRGEVNFYSDALLLERPLLYAYFRSHRKSSSTEYV